MAREEIRLQYGKFNGDEHWAFDLEILGTDAHGTWLGGKAGTKGTRPGKTFSSRTAFVTLLPANDAWWVATFNASPEGNKKNIEVYVDITTPTTINTGEAFTLDLDLDVVRRTSGAVEIVDEDEFQTNSVEMGYPPRVVNAAREAAQSVKELIEAGAAPFDGSHETWLKKL